jgi:DNA-binding NarL/FixJ family response regulator
MTAPIRIVVADDHPMFRYGITAALATVPDVTVVGEASDGHELIAITADTRPDVVLTDLTMPGMDGITATRHLLAADPNLGVLVLTMHDDDDYLYAALRAGARGYLLKGADRTRIVRAIHTVAAGEAVYGPAIARRIVDTFTAAASAATPAAPLPPLTDRERDVLHLLATGHRNSEIAARLHLADKTIRNHISAILAKLHVTDRTAAALKARAAGLGGPPANRDS